MEITRTAVTDGNGVYHPKPPRATGVSRVSVAQGVLVNPSTCRRILIVGAGGFGREVLHWARDAWPDYAEKIVGFLSADPSRSVPLPIVGDPTEFRPVPGDAFLLAIGIPGVRRVVAESLIARNAYFLTLIHPSAMVSMTAVVEDGCIVGPFSIASDATRLGRFSLLNYHSSLGHDASTGDYAVLSPYATLGGGARISDDVFVGLHGSVGPGKSVGSRSKVSANTCVLTDAPSDCLIFGVPGRVVMGIASTPHR